MHFLFSIILPLTTFLNIKSEATRDYYTFDSLDYFGISLGMEPYSWGVFIDTLNDYFILYDQETEFEWPAKIIQNTQGIVKGEKRKIINYGRKIEATSFSSSVIIKKTPIIIKVFNYYYTTEKCSDNLVWDFIPSFVRQLSLGFGLDVHDPKFSLIHMIYESGFITRKCFSFEGKIGSTVNIGHLPEERLKEYQYNATFNIPPEEKNWGISIDSLVIEGMKYKVSKYALINSSINNLIRSFDLYNIFKDYFNQDIMFKGRCEEKNQKIQCKTRKTEINKNVTINTGNNPSFNISLKHFFKCSGESCLLLVSYDEKDDNVNQENNTIQFGFPFIKLFDLFEFDFDKRTVAIYDQKIKFFYGSFDNPITMKIIKYSLIIIMGFVGMFCCFLLYIKIIVYKSIS